MDSMTSKQDLMIQLTDILNKITENNTNIHEMFKCLQRSVTKSAKIVEKAMKPPDDDCELRNRRVSASTSDNVATHVRKVIENQQNNKKDDDGDHYSESSDDLYSDDDENEEENYDEALNERQILTASFRSNNKATGFQSVTGKKQHDFDTNIGDKDRSNGSAYDVDDDDDDLDEGENDDANNATDSKWTLRHPGPGQGLDELIPGSGVFIDAYKFGYIKRVSKNYTIMGRKLLPLIFSASALHVCSLAGSKSAKSTRRPGLDKHAVSVLFRFIRDFSQEKSWTNFYKKKLAISLRCKILEMRKNKKYGFLQQHGLSL